MVVCVFIVAKLIKFVEFDSLVDRKGTCVAAPRAEEFVPRKARERKEEEIGCRKGAIFPRINDAHLK